MKKLYRCIGGMVDLNKGCEYISCVHRKPHKWITYGDKYTDGCFTIFKLKRPIVYTSCMCLRVGNKTAKLVAGLMKRGSVDTITHIPCSRGGRKEEY